MKGIDVDPDAAHGRAPRAALTWGELDAATQEHGLAVTGGRVSDHRHRRARARAAAAAGSSASFGFTCDNLIEAEVVTADGRMVVASEDENPDLFWGLRGGGGNFGVVTAFHFRLHPVGPDRARRHAHVPGARWRPSSCASTATSCADAPDEVGSGLAFITAPPEDFVPEPVRGQPVVGDRVLLRRPGRGGRGGAPRRCASSARRGSTWCSRCPTSRCSSCSTRRTRRACRTTGRPTSSPSCPTRRSTSLVEHATKPVSPLTQIILVPGGGAIARVDEDATAFGQRTRAVEHPLPVDVARPGRHRDEHRLHPRRSPSAMKPWTHRAGLPELHRRRGRRPGRGRLRAREVRAAAGAQGRVGPDQPVPPQPEHRPRRPRRSDARRAP